MAETRQPPDLLAQLREANERLLVVAVEADSARELAAYNEARFRSLVTTSAAIVWQADPDGTVRFDSESWQAFTGGPANEGDEEFGWLQYVHPDDRDRVREAWERAVATSTPYELQHQLKKRAGGYAWVVSRGVPIIQAGVVREWLGMMTDVTDRVQIEEAREEFIGILGHDLLNPLTAISVGIVMLSSLPDPHADVVALISRSTQRMEAIIRDVLDFARGRLGRGIPVFARPCDLGKIALDVTAEMVQAHPDRDIHIETVGDMAAECDADRVGQVLSNLLGNAVAHGTDPIRVRLAADEGAIVMTVSNGGAPIPDSLLPRLFEPFVRSSRKPRSRDGSEGLGLGLYIASQIVHAHGGTIDVLSTAEAGTTFSVRMPRHAAPVRIPT